MKGKAKLVCIFVLLSIFAIVVYGVAQNIQFSPTVNYQVFDFVVQVSFDKATWQSNDLVIRNIQAWYSRILVSQSTVMENITLKWSLQNFVSGSWGDCKPMEDAKVTVISGDIQSYVLDFDWNSLLVPGDFEISLRYRVKVEVVNNAEV